MEVLDKRNAKATLTRLEKAGGEVVNKEFPTRTTWGINKCSGVSFRNTLMMAPIFKRSIIGQGMLSNCLLQNTSIDGIGAYSLNLNDFKVISSTISKMHDGYFEKCNFLSGTFEKSHIHSGVFNYCKFQDFCFKENNSSKMVFNNCEFRRVVFSGQLNTVNFNDCSFDNVDFSDCKMSEVLFGKHCFVKVVFPSRQDNFAISSVSLFETQDELKKVLSEAGIKAYNELLSYYPRSGLTVVDRKLFNGIERDDLESVFLVLKKRQMKNPVTLSNNE